MEKVNKFKLAVSVLLTLLMMFVVFQAAFAEQVNFPLMTRDNSAMVADENTRYLTLLEQDPVTRLITATISVRNESTGVGARPIVIAGVGFELSFNGSITPYNRATGTRYVGPTREGIAEFSEAMLVKTFDTVGSSVVESVSGVGGFIGGKISAADDRDTITIQPGQAVSILKLYFMPASDIVNTTLTLDMFSFKYSTYTQRMIELTTWIANGTNYVVSNTRFPSTSYRYVLSPSTFKIHVQQAKPVVSANNDTRLITGYDTATMEWSYDVNGPYNKTAPVVKDEAHIIYVRKAETAYSGSDAEYGNYKKYLASEAVPVQFDADTVIVQPGDAKLSKTGVNLTPHADGKLHVGDRIRYTVIAANDGPAKSVWTNAVMTDTLREGVTFAANVTLNGAALTSPGGYTFENGVLTVPLGNIPGTTQKTVTFEVTVNADAYGKNIRNSVSVTGKDSDGGSDLRKDADEGGTDHTVVPKSATPLVDDINAGDKVITGMGKPGATIRVRFPNGATVDITVPGSGTNDVPWSVDVPNGVNLVTGDEVIVTQIEPAKDPSDPVNKIVGDRPPHIPVTDKTAQNLTRSDGTRRVGDTLRYTITLKNNGPAKSLWVNASIVDVMPEEVDFIAGSVKIDGVDATTNPNVIYNAVTRTLTVTIDSIASGVTKTVTFEAKINDTAYGKSFKNTAIIDGKPVIEDPDDPPPVVRRSVQPVIDDINEGDRVITGTGVPGATVEVSFPNSSVKAPATVGANGTWSVNVPPSVNLLEGDVVTAVQTEPGYDTSLPVSKTVQEKTDVIPTMSKTSENLTSTDGKIHVNDRLKYTITVGNSGSSKSNWTDTVLTDVLPVGITLVAGTVQLDGQPAMQSYNPVTRTLLVTISGGIRGGQERKITFEATVDADAYGKDIRNAASVTGKANGGSTDVTKDTQETDPDRTVTGKSEQPTVNPIDAGDDKVSGKGKPGAKVKVTFPGGPTVEVPVDNNGDWNADVPPGVTLNPGDEVKVVQIDGDKDPSDEVKVIVGEKVPPVKESAKTARNLTRNDGTRRVGDTLEYAITLKNAGPAKSLWVNATIVDPLPEEVDFVTGSVKIDGVAAGAAAIYNAAAHTLTVVVDSIASGVTKSVTFEVVINEKAFDNPTFKNTAKVDDKDTEEGPDDPPPVIRRSAQPEVDTINEGDKVITGKGVPGAKIDISFPNSTAKGTATVGADGKWAVNVPPSVNLLEGDVVSVVQTEPDYYPSAPVLAEVYGMTSVVPYMSKTSANLTSTDGKTRVGDKLRYTVVVGNSGAKSVWTSAVFTDALPAGVTLAGDVYDIVLLDGVRPTFCSYNPATRTLQVTIGTIQAGQERVVTFDVTVNANAHGMNIKNAAAVDGKENGGGKDVHFDTEEPGGGRDVLNPSSKPTVDDIFAGDDTITGEGVPDAEITVTLPDGTEIKGKVDKDGKWSVKVPPGKEPNVGDKVNVTQTEEGKDVSEPVEVIVESAVVVPESAKTSANLSRNDGTRRVKDLLQYTITAKNAGAIKSLWRDVIVTDQLPEEVDFINGSVKIDGVTTGSPNVVYNSTTHTLTVNLGNIAGGVTKTVTFEAMINDKAYDNPTFKNTAIVDGKPTEEGPDDPPPVIPRSVQPTVDEINEGDKVITGKGVPGATIEVTFPNSTTKVPATVDANGDWSVNVPANVNLIEGDIVKVVQIETGKDPSLPVEKEVQAGTEVVPYMSKTAENLTSTDNKIHVNDRLKYTIVIGNSGSAKSNWTDTVLTDVLPVGVTLVTGSVQLDGQNAMQSYNPVTRTLLVTISGGIRGGQEKKVTFEVTVDADAYGKDIRNAAAVDGKGNGGTTDVREETEEEDDDRTVVDKSEQPTVNDVTRGDDKIRGKGKPGAKIEVELDDGAKIDTTVDGDGNWEVPIPPGKEPDTGDTIKVIQTEDDKDPSVPVIVIVKDKSYRAVHGLVSPLVGDNKGMGGAFLNKHAIVVELRSTFRTPAAAELSTFVTPVAGNTDGLGEFTIEEVPFGDYILYIHRPGHLTRAMEVTISPTDLDMIELMPPPTDPNDNDIFKLWWGDCNGSLRIDNEDVLMIMELMDLDVDKDSPLYNPACDLNGDGLIDNEDILMVIENWNKFVRQYAGGENINYLI